MDWDLAPALVAEARKRAASAARRWRSIVPRDELYQEAVIWAALHPATIAAHLEADPVGGMDRVGWDIRRRLDKVCQREKDRRAGCFSYEEARDGQE